MCFSGIQFVADDYPDFIWLEPVGFKVKDYAHRSYVNSGALSIPP
jgi:hypothetical protein